MRIYTGNGDHDATLVAADHIIRDLDLDVWANEHIDRAVGVLFIDIIDGAVRVETCRTMRAYKAGAPSAGRSVLTLDRRTIGEVWVDGARIL